MIKFEHTEVFGFEHAIRGMRNPLNSWDKSDSGICMEEVACHTCKESRNNCKKNIENKNFVIGYNDMNLMKRLKKAGTDHRKYLRMITVYVDITAPMYWWSEFDTYKVGTVSNSTSKMHKLLSKPFEMNDFSFDKLAGYKNEVKQFRPIIEEDMVAKEVWKVFSDDYDISNYGRIRHNFKNHYRIISGSIHKDGYIFVNLYGKQYPLHKLVAQIFHSIDYKEGFVVNHKDGNKQNNFADNLEWVSQSENINHSIENDLKPKGLSTYKGKFTQEKRNEIKRLWDSGEKSKRQIAKEYGVSHTCINDIINDKYKYANTVNLFEEVARPLVDTLNELRDDWFREEDIEKKKIIWYSILQLLPNSYNQKRTVMLNYEVLNNIYKSRKNHKLDEWSKGFIQWIETLPYYKELIIGE